MDQDNTPRKITFEQIRKESPYRLTSLEDEEEDRAPLNIYRKNRMIVEMKTCVTINDRDYYSPLEKTDNVLGLMLDCTVGRGVGYLRHQHHLYRQVLEESPFCDVTLKFAGMTMKAHWCVLVSCPFFEGLYNSCMTERETGEVQMQVPNGEAMRAAIVFLYTGLVDIRTGNLKQLLELADYLQLQELTESCSDFMEDLQLSVENCILLMHLSEKYNVHTYDRVFDYFKGHLLEEMEEEMMLKFSPESLLLLLHDTTLSYVPPSAFFNFIVKWTRHDLARRQCFFEALFLELNLSKLEPNFLNESVLKCDLVNASEKCKLRLSAVEICHRKGEPDCSMEDVVLIAGGKRDVLLRHSSYSDSDLLQSSVYGYVINENRWTRLAPLPQKMAQPRMAFSPHSHSVFAFDGAMGALLPGNKLRLYKFDTKENLWTDLEVSFPAIQKSTIIHSILSCNGTLWFVASDNVLNGTTGAEDGLISLFEMVEDDPQCRFRGHLFTVTSATKVQSIVVNNQYVCVIGSEFVHPRRNANAAYKWVHVQYIDVNTMETENVSKGAEFDDVVYSEGNVLFMADFDGSRTKKFNFQTRKWKSRKQGIPLPNLHAGRNDFMSVVDDRKVYMMGGRHPLNLCHTSNVCRYDLDKRRWETLPDIPHPLIYSGAVTVRIPVELVSCHQNCPHCLFTPKHRQAIYHCTDGSRGRKDRDDGDNSEDTDAEPTPKFNHVTGAWEAEVS